MSQLPFDLVVAKSGLLGLWIDLRRSAPHLDMRVLTSVRFPVIFAYSLVHVLHVGPKHRIFQDKRSV